MLDIKENLLYKYIKKLNPDKNKIEVLDIGTSLNPDYLINTGWRFYKEQFVPTEQKGIKIDRIYRKKGRN